MDMDVSLSMALAQLTREKVGRNNPFVSGVLMHQGQDSGTTLVELSLRRPITSRIFNLKPGDGHGSRLVVDFYPAAPTVAIALSMTDASGSKFAISGMRSKAVPDTVLPMPVQTSKIDLSAAGIVANSVPQEAWFEVHINHESVGTALVLQDVADHVLISGHDLAQWRIRRDGLKAIHHGAVSYYPLDAITGLSYHIEKSSQSLWLDVSANLFDITTFNGTSRGLSEPTPSPPGAFLDYDVYVNRSRGQSMNGSAFLESGAFGRWGNATNTLLARRIDGQNHAIRLDTTWSYDHPSTMASFRFGDDISGSSGWGRSVRFGGVQWATNFATQPSFVILPMPTLGGIAATPSTVDLYVNNMLRLKRDVPSGPFSIQDLPVITGQGEIRLVVRDLLGREQTVLEPFYASSGLLAKGLRDFSYEAGFERENYALDSNDYGPFVAVATERRGLSDTFTGELHAEVLRDQQTVGVGGTYLLSTAGVLTASVATSHRAAGSGGLVSLGFQRQTGRVSYGLQTQLTSPRFIQLGYDPRNLPPRQTSTAFVSLGTHGLGSFGVNYAHQDFRDREDLELIGASYSRQIWQLGYLALSAQHILGDAPETLFSLSITVPFDERSTASINTQFHDGTSHAELSVQQNLPVGTGMGYHVQAGMSASDPRQAGIALQNDVGAYSFDVAESQGREGYQGSVRGGIALLGDKVFFSRNIKDSFAVVQVPGYANVRVYADNHQIGTTDSKGYALVPQLRPYQKNPIRIEQSDLPMDAAIGSLAMDAVPYQHGALMLKFPVTRSRGAVLTIILEDGSVLPAGAEVSMAGHTESFPVGMRGEVYLTGLMDSNTVRVTWQGQSCDLAFDFSETSDPLPHLGPLTCAGVRP
ncbi:fimbria/pilus outer membrane usher protein [Rhodanobacter sp. Col0626]|uniref:fimbria/pilus outer membrane usher protein n=1 Tax=Rhodanobacter sp. Col0626 TaxID=3415679 RepID=UPI003CF967CF